MRRMLCVALLVVAIPARAQTVHDLAAYFGTAYTTGIEAPHVEQPMLGDQWNVWGVHAFYTHLSFGDFGGASGTGVPSATGNAYGGSVSASFLEGTLGVTAMGGYLVRSCPADVACAGFTVVGGNALYRLLRAPIAGDSDSRVTVSLRAAGGWAFAPDSDRYYSFNVGIPIALSAPEGSNYRIVGFLTPGLTGASLKTVTFDAGGSPTPFHHDGTRGMLSGGVGFVPTRAGVGLDLGFQKIFVDHSGTQFSASLTWNLPRLGDH